MVLVRLLSVGESRLFRAKKFSKTLLKKLLVPLEKRLRIIDAFDSVQIEFSRCGEEVIAPFALAFFCEDAFCNTILLSGLMQN